jgi:hypothetical protein
VKDTPDEVERTYQEMLMQRSGEERLRMGSRMFDVARRLIRASLGDPDGRDSSSDMRVALFLRIYGADFDAAARERIVAELRRESARG